MSATIQRSPLTLNEIKAELRARGYDGIRAMSGRLDLDAWDPYGMEGINRKFFGPVHYRGELVESESGLRVRDWSDEPPRHPFALGCWEPMRPEVSS